MGMARYAPSFHWPRMKKMTNMVSFLDQQRELIEVKARINFGEVVSLLAQELHEKIQGDFGGEIIAEQQEFLLVAALAFRNQGDDANVHSGMQWLKEFRTHYPKYDGACDVVSYQAARNAAEQLKWSVEDKRSIIAELDANPPNGDKRSNPKSERILHGVATFITTW